MTIAVCLKVMDGIVLGADSASTLATPWGVENVFDNANKIVNLRKGFPIGIIFWGAGAIGESSMTTLAKDLRVRFSDENAHEWHLDRSTYSVEEVTKRVVKFLREEHYDPWVSAFREMAKQHQTPDGAEPSELTLPSLGFFVAGYSAGAQQAECWEVSVDESGGWSVPAQVIPHDAAGTQWRGQPEWISRLLIGFSSQLAVSLLEDFQVPEADLTNALALIQNRTEVTLLHPAMPIQDAIDLARFLVEMTKAVSRFIPGAQTVGGPTEIAAITKHEGFKWASRKYYYDQAFNPRVEGE